MIKKLFPLACLALVGLVYADATSDAQKTIQSKMNAAVAAYKMKNVKPYLALLAPEFKGTDALGTTRNKKEFGEAMTSQLGSIKAITVATYKILSLKLTKGQAIVKSSTTIGGPFNDGKRTIQVERTGTSQSVWVSRKGAWLMLSNKSLTSQLKVDGKVIPPPK